MEKRLLKNINVAFAVAMAVMLIGCGAEEKTYSEGLREGFETGYTVGLFDYDSVAANTGKVVVYAEKYGYLTGYHDGIVGFNRIEDLKYDNKMLLEDFVTGYDKGYSDAIDGKDMLEEYGLELPWHSVTPDDEQISEAFSKALMDGEFDS